MAKASENIFPKVRMSTTVSSAAPSGGEWRLESRANGIYAVSSNTGSAGTGPFGVAGAGLADQGTATYLDFTTAAAPANPAAGKIRVYSKTGDTLSQRTSGGTETVFGAGGGGAPTSAKYITTAADATLSAEIVIPGVLVPDRIPASPSASNDEFDTTSTLTTVIGTLNQNNTTDFASNLRLANTATGALQLHGAYKANPSMPFTMTWKLSDMMFNANFQGCGGFVAEATPGAYLVYASTHVTGVQTASRSTWSNRTTRTAGTDATPPAPWYSYWRMVVTSSTDIVCQVSRNGYVWMTTHTTVNPGFTVGAVGLVVTGFDNSVSAEGIFDWLRFT